MLYVIISTYLKCVCVCVYVTFNPGHYLNLINLISADMTIFIIDRLLSQRTPNYFIHSAPNRLKTPFENDTKH